jgi:hypothetical protein
MQEFAMQPRIIRVTGLRAVSTCVEHALFFRMPHALTVNGIHVAEKCSSRKIKVLLASGLLTIAPACGFAQPAIAPAQQVCAAGEAQSVVGQPYSVELADMARRAAGAREVRKIEPGGAYTMDLSPDRLNIEVDSTGIVTGLRCG